MKYQINKRYVISFTVIGALILGFYIMLPPQQQEVVDVSIIQLIATPEKYHNKKINISGVVSLSREAHYICLTDSTLKCVYDTDIWLEFNIVTDANNKIIGTDMAKYSHEDGNYVVIWGVFDANKRARLAGNQGVIKNIIRLESGS